MPYWLKPSPRPEGFFLSDYGTRDTAGFRAAFASWLLSPGGVPAFNTMVTAMQKDERDRLAVKLQGKSCFAQVAVMNCQLRLTLSRTKDPGVLRSWFPPTAPTASARDRMISTLGLRLGDFSRSAPRAVSHEDVERVYVRLHPPEHIRWYRDTSVKDSGRSLVKHFRSRYPSVRSLPLKGLELGSIVEATLGPRWSLRRFENLAQSPEWSSQVRALLLIQARALSRRGAFERPDDLPKAFRVGEWRELTIELFEHNKDLGQLLVAVGTQAMLPLVRFLKRVILESAKDASPGSKLRRDLVSAQRYARRNDNTKDNRLYGARIHTENNLKSAGITPVTDRRAQAHERHVQRELRKRRAGH